MIVILCFYIFSRFQQTSHLFRSTMQATLGTHLTFIRLEATSIWLTYFSGKIKWMSQIPYIQRYQNVSWFCKLYCNVRNVLGRISDRESVSLLLLLIIIRKPLLGFTGCRVMLIQMMTALTGTFELIVSRWIFRCTSSVILTFIAV